MPVSTVYAEIDADASACIIAPNGSGTGVSFSNAAAVTADSRATGSNARGRAVQPPGERA